ncbi:MAG: TrmH family RNA methyltransferase [Phycisphaerales bacterium]
MPTIHVTDLADPRLADYSDVRERQLAAEFLPRSAPGTGPAGTPEAPFGKFMAEGEVVFRRLVESRFRTLSVLCTPARAPMVAALVAALNPEPPVYVIERPALERLVGFHLHRGLIAIGAREAPADPITLIRHPGAYVILEDLTNHDNVGAVFRNAAAFGARAILLSPRCADPLYRKSIRVSVGHALHVPFAWLDSWPEGLATLTQAGIHLVALSPGNPGQALREWSWPRAARVGMMFGSEGPGLSDGALQHALDRVMIPMNAGVDSLNVAVTSAVVLEHLRWLKGRNQQGLRE